MNTRVIRKAIGLLIVDIFIIIGIFIIQFRTDSSILKKFGNFQITLARAETENAPYSLQNKFEVSYNGITLHGNDQDCITIVKKGEPSARQLKLIDFIEDDLQYTLKFTEDVSLIFMFSQDTLESPLTIFADIPKDITDMYVPFNFAYNMKVQKDESNRVILQGKKQMWSFSSDGITDNYLHFSYSDNIAHYSVYDDTKKFSFDSITQLASAEKSAFDQTLTAFNANLISAFKSSLNDSSFTEQAVVAYISAMSKEGKYQQAIDEIPQDYKRSESRTYLSAPFLNNLANMNKTLDTAISDWKAQIKNAASQDSLEIFTVQDIAAKLCIYPDTDTVNSILQKAADSDIENCTINQVNGIMIAYSDLSRLQPKYASILAPAMEKCIEKLTAACSYENALLTISENDTFLSVVQAAEAGMALLRYGQISGTDTYIRAGRVLVNSYLAESASFDLRTLATLYPMLQYDNWYYPHIELINSYGKNAVWAWTCAKEVAYSKTSEGAMNLAIDFPEGLTHYVIFKGIPAFEQIFIYDMAFRTDPRFETYNSSGYVYKSDSETLLLKSRHKSRIENVRMSYTPVPKPAPAPKPAEPEPEPAPETTAEPDILIEPTAESTRYPAGTVIE